MTLDTSAMVAQWREAIARGGHRAYSIPVVEMVALLDALEAERERVRVLTKYLSGFDVTEDGEVRDEDGEPYEDTFIVNIGMQAAGIKEIHAALATAGGEGATT